MNLDKLLIKWQMRALLSRCVKGFTHNALNKNRKAESNYAFRIETYSSTLIKTKRLLRAVDLFSKGEKR